LNTKLDTGFFFFKQGTESIHHSTWKRCGSRR